MTMPIVTINKITIANFSSPHTFKFTSGDVLLACEPERSKDLMLRAEEVKTAHPGGWTDIDLTFHLNNCVEKALLEAHDSPVDVIIVPFPVLSAVKAAGKFEQFSKIRTIRSADRVTKTVHPDQFCK